MQRILDYGYPFSILQSFCLLVMVLVSRCDGISVIAYELMERPGSQNGSYLLLVLWLHTLYVLYFLFRNI